MESIIKHQTNLISLAVNGNEFDFDTALKITEMPNLKEVWLGAYEFTKEQQSKIHKILSEKGIEH